VREKTDVFGGSVPVPWGKTSDVGRHPLVDHCLDVALVLRALLDLPNLARLGSLTEAQKDRLAVIAFIHDFGKCNWGFQAKADPTARDTAGHVFEGVALLEELGDRWPPAWRTLLDGICTWFRDEAQAYGMLLASISHHGRPVSVKDYYDSCVERKASVLWSSKSGYDPLAALDGLARAAITAFPSAFDAATPRLDATPALQQRFAGLVMLADWIGSDTTFFPYRASPDENRHALATRQAREALRLIGLTPPGAREPRPFEEIFRDRLDTPTPLQAELAYSLPVEEDQRLLLIESDTGSGKTEAALAWFFRLYAESKVDGLYFALPTRVAARELYERIHQAVDAAFAPDASLRPVLLAVPGYVKVDGVAVLPNPRCTLWHDSSSDERREQIWAAERPKRFLAAPVCVGTIDQALLSALQVKHSLLRSVCLDRHLLVVDEVHASDTYMKEVLHALLTGHIERGGWAVLLSATLGESAASAFFCRPAEPLEKAVERPYPALTTRAEVRTVPQCSRTRRIEITLERTLTENAAVVPQLIDAIRKGARVLVVCNTVARANALTRQIESTLEDETPELLSAIFALNGVRCPHHGRFARADRERLDEHVTALMGKRSTASPLLLVGTQTLEQSLDIDADWIVTDLAPMDVLLQRFGRLHRHARPQRPDAYAAPRATIRAPEKPLASFLERDGRLRGPAGIGTVYEDGRVLQRTLEELERRRAITLPDDARALIEHTTHPDAWSALAVEWRAHGHWLDGKRLADIRAALAAVLKNEPFGDLHYGDKSERVVTRLGAASLDVPLSRVCRSPFGADIDRITIPAHLLPPLSEGTVPEAIEAMPGRDGFRFSIGDCPFRYTRFGLEKDDA